MKIGRFFTDKLDWILCKCVDWIDCYIGYYDTYGYNKDIPDGYYLKGDGKGGCKLVKIK